jgi:signal transduction histidine kinase
MDDRVGAIGGSIQVESAPGLGTTIRGRIPLTD